MHAGRDDSALAECLGADLASAFESWYPDLIKNLLMKMGRFFYCHHLNFIHSDFKPSPAFAFTTFQI